MGLDMYLTKKSYVKNWDHTTTPHEVSVVHDGNIRKDIRKDRVSHVEEELITWRKANHFHNYFITNCAKGEDDCKPIYVDLDNLIDLRNICEEVIKELTSSSTKEIEVKVGWGNEGDIIEKLTIFTDTERVEEILPTMSGFFFGSTDYDEWYLESVKDTKVKLDDIISEIEEVLKEGHYCEIYYEASW